MRHLAVLSLIAFLLSPPRIFAADNSLLNSDFENWSDQVPNNWTKNVSTVTISESSQDVHSGSKAVILKSTSSSTKYLYQLVSITPGSSYTLSGWAKILSGSGNAYLRVTQCSDANCSESKYEIKSDDSTHVADGSWNNQTINFTAAGNAASAKIKINLDPASSSEALVLWDDLTVTTQQSSPPPGTPSPSPSISPSPAPPPSAQTQKPTVTFDFAPPSTLSVGEQFNLPIKMISNLDSAPYYLKVRIGPDDSHLSHGQTHNSDWLDDNDSWSKFPQITGPTWQGNVAVRLPSNEGEGTYKIAVRVKKTSSDTFAESDTKEIHFKPGVPSASPSKSPSPVTKSPTPVALRTNPSVQTPNPTSLLSADSQAITDVLGASSESSPQAATISQPPPGPVSLHILSSQQKLPVKDLLISSGLFLAGFALTFVLRGQISNRHV